MHMLIALLFVLISTGAFAQQGNRFGVPPFSVIGAVALPQGSAATLPLCNNFAAGVLRAVTDANSTTFNATVAGGGSNTVLAFCDGTNWKIH